MSWHVYGAVLTASGVASNNRGENAGNVSTLQKILWKGDIYTTVSAEAIRHAMREYWTASGEAVNRRVEDGESSWNDPTFENWQEYVDDDLLGFMDPKKETVKRRGRLEITRAVSTRPWTGDTVFSVASPNAHARGNEDPTPYSVEVHATRYQYLFALTPERLAYPTRAELALAAIENLHRVAGNHSRYLYEFAPDGIVLRLTHDPVPRLMYPFDEDEFGEIRAEKLVRGLSSGDLDGSEIVVAGGALESLKSDLESQGATWHDGIRAAFNDIRSRLANTEEA